MRDITDFEWVVMGSKMLLVFEAAGFPKGLKGTKALYCIACVAATKGEKGEPYSWARLAHEYGEFSGNNQMAVWESMRRVLRRMGRPETVGEALAWAVMEVGRIGKN